MATPITDPNLNPISDLKKIGNIRRPELQSIGTYRTTETNQYSKTHPYIYSEGINGDNYGKEPAQAPATPQDAYYSVGGKDDIKARIGSDSPGTIAQNEYRAGKEYKVDW
jgi:hypothetical protein